MVCFRMVVVYIWIVMMAVICGQRLTFSVFLVTLFYLCFLLSFTFTKYACFFVTDIYLVVVFGAIVLTVSMGGVNLSRCLSCSNTFLDWIVDQQYRIFLDWIFFSRAGVNLSRCFFCSNTFLIECESAVSDLFGLNFF